MPSGRGESAADSSQTSSNDPGGLPPQTLDLRCARCSYALRGLDPLGRCPECGLPIAETIELVARPDLFSPYWLRMREHWSGPPLGESDPRWVRRVAFGVLGLPVSAALLVAWCVRKQSLDYWATVPDYGLLAVSAWFAGAVWLAATPERPRASGAIPWKGPDQTWRIVRRGARALAFVPALAAGLAVRSEQVPVADHTAYARAGMLVLVASPLLTILLFDYLAYLAARLPGIRLAITLRLVMMISTALAVLIALVSLASGRHERVPEYASDAVQAMLRGACCGAGVFIVVPIVALMLTLAIRLMSEVGRVKSTQCP